MTMDPKPGTVPSLGFAAGAGILLYYWLPVPQGLDPEVGIAALTAVVTPLALIGRAAVDRLVTKIKGAAE